MNTLDLKSVTSSTQASPICKLNSFITTRYKQHAYTVTFRTLRKTDVEVEKAISITYSEILSVALGMQHANNISFRRPIILSRVTCPALQYFSTLSHKRYDFRKKVTELKMCVLVFSTTFV